MKRAIHQLHPKIKAREPGHEDLMPAWCGARSSRIARDPRDVTCERCNRIACKRIWVTR